MAETLFEQEYEDMSRPNEYALLQQSAETAEVLEHHIPVALALDFDRTLGDVGAAVTRLYDAAKVCGVDTGRIKAAQQQIEADGGSFDPLSLVKGSLDEAAYGKFRELFVSAEGPQILYDDAKDFLARLQEKDIPHVILTYGTNREWQELKLEASGYAAGRKIMPHSDKGVEMDGLRGADGTYDLTNASGSVYRAEHMTLLDDKALSFDSLPEDCDGILVQRGELLPSQRGTVPERVKSVSSLREVVIRPDGTLDVAPADDAAVFSDRSMYLQHPQVYAPIENGAMANAWLP